MNRNPHESRAFFRTSFPPVANVPIRFRSPAILNFTRALRYGFWRAREKQKYRVSKVNGQTCLYVALCGSRSPRWVTVSWSKELPLQRDAHALWTHSFRIPFSSLRGCELFGERCRRFRSFLRTEAQRDENRAINSERCSNGLTSSKFMVVNSFEVEEKLRMKKQSAYAWIEFVEKY